MTRYPHFVASIQQCLDVGNSNGERQESIVDQVVMIFRPAHKLCEVILVHPHEQLLLRLGNSNQRRMIFACGPFPNNEIQ